MMNNVKYTKVCSITGEGMYEGYYAKLDGNEYYFKYSSDAIFWCVSNGFESVDDAFDKGAIEYMSWDDGSAGEKEPYIQQCQESIIYNLDVAYLGNVYKVEYTQTNDDWAGRWEELFINDEYGYALNESNPEYIVLKNFVKKIKNKQE